MMRKIKNKILNIVKHNKILTFASLVFVLFSGINIYLIYNFVQVLSSI